MAKHREKKIILNIPAKMSRRALAKNQVGASLGQRRCTSSANGKTQNKKIRSATQSAKREESNLHVIFFHGHRTSRARYRRAV
jgi:hypothetical protein